MSQDSEQVPNSEKFADVARTSMERLAMAWVGLLLGQLLLLLLGANHALDPDLVFYALFILVLSMILVGSAFLRRAWRAHHRWGTAIGIMGLLPPLALLAYFLLIMLRLS